MNSLRFVSIFALACAHHSIAEQQPTTTQSSSYNLAAYITYAQSWIPSWQSLPAIPTTYNPINYIPSWPQSMSPEQEAEYLEKIDEKHEASSKTKIESFEQLHEKIDILVQKIEDPLFIDTDYESVITLHRQLTLLTKQKESFYADALDAIEVKKTAIAEEKNSTLQKLDADYQAAEKNHLSSLARLSSDEEKEQATKTFDETVRANYQRYTTYAQQTHDRKMDELQAFDLSCAQASYKRANERLYQLIENFDTKNQKAIIKTQIEHNQERKADPFDEVISTKRQPSIIYIGILDPKYWRPFEFQANADRLKSTGCINHDGSINDNLPQGSARKLIATIALNLKNSQAEDGFHHMIGLQQCIKYKTAAGIQVDCQTVIDDLNRAAHEEMLARRAAKKIDYSSPK